MKDENDPLKKMRKVPYIVFFGKQEKLDVQVITQI